MGERYGDHVGPSHLINDRQQRAGENAVIVSHPSDQVGKDHPVHHAVRVVRHNDHRPLFRNTVQLVLGRLQFDPHDIKCRTPEGLPLWRALLLKLAYKSQNGQATGQHFDRAYESSFFRITKSRRV